MKIEKILFHTRFREFSFNALETLLMLKMVGLKEIILVYIINREEVGFVPYGGYLKEEEDRIREAANLHFEKWQQILSDKGIQSRALVEKGTPNVTLLKVAQDNGVDLIVTGRKKRSLLEKVYVGSHILDLLRRSPIPVLMYKYQVEYEGADGTYTRVNDDIFKIPLVATDWSEPSQSAVKYMQAFKGLVDKVQVTHVIESKMIKHDDENIVKSLKQECQKLLEKDCNQLKQMGISSESYMAIGKTTPEIIRLSREYGATMIVMGRTGKDWFEEYWLGGVSHRVAEISELPVLLVP